MYICPKNSTHEEFTREAVQPVRQSIAADGNVLETTAGAITDPGYVYCALEGCEARAEWVDPQQKIFESKLYAEAPTMF